MKILILLLIGFQSFAQDTILLKNGSTIIATESSVRVDPMRKALYYKLAETPKIQKVKWNAVNSATFDQKVFKAVTQNNKRKGFYIMADANGTKLGVLPRTNVVNKGGFDSYYKSYQVVVINADDQVTADISFSDLVNDRNAELRAKAAELVTNNFSNCSALVEKLHLLQSTDDIISNLGVITFFDSNYLTKCK